MLPLTSVRKFWLLKHHHYLFGALRNQWQLQLSPFDVFLLRIHRAICRTEEVFHLFGTLVRCRHLVADVHAAGTNRLQILKPTTKMIMTAWTRLKEQRLAIQDIPQVSPVVNYAKQFVIQAKFNLLTGNQRIIFSPLKSINYASLFCLSLLFSTFYIISNY